MRTFEEKSSLIAELGNRSVPRNTAHFLPLAHGSRTKFE